MSDDDLWHEDARRHGWVMPAAAWWQRLPIIRHVRAAWHSRQVKAWESMWRSVGLVPRGYDRWVIYGIATGKERKK